MNTNPLLSKYIEDLKKCKSYLDVLKYCNRTFKHVLGEGSSRKVYKIPHFCLVVKVATKDFGLKQNKTESIVYKKCKNNVSIISKIYDYDKDGYKWVISEYCYVNGCDESDNRMDLFIKKTIGIDGPLLRLLCILCMTNKSIQILDKDKKEFVKFTNWIKSNIDKLYNMRMTDKKKYRKYLFDYIQKHFPNLLRHSKSGDFCLHYYFITCLYHLRKIEPKLLFDYLYNKKFTKIQFIMDFRKLTKIIGFDLLDSIDVGNMGLVRRDGKKYLVLLDYGYTELKV